jgi:DNA-binding MarR family transcriptional regulator
MLGRSGGPLLAFHAPRGLGKTSLLRMAQRDALAEGYLTVWVTGRDDQPMSPGLVQALSAAVTERSFGERAKALVHRLEQVQLEFGIPSAKVGATVRAGESPLLPASAVIEELLEEAGKFARSHEHKGLVVFVDEFHEARVPDRKSLLIALQHFDGDPGGCPVAVIAAGLPSLPAAVTEAATFGERSRFVELGLLSDVAVAEALRVPAEHHGVGWADGAVEAAIAIAGGYPHKVQLIGQAAWEVARPERRGQILAGHVRQARDEVEEQMLGLFRTRMARVTPEQRRLLLAMAELGGDIASRSEIAARLGVDTNALSRPRQELIDRGLVEPAGHGRLRFTIPGFGAYLRENA